MTEPIAPVPPSSGSSDHEKDNTPRQSSGEAGPQTDSPSKAPVESRLRRCRTAIEEFRHLAVDGLIIIVVVVLGAAIVKAAIQPRVVIDAITVPKELVERGYTGEVMAQRVLDEIQEINKTVKTVNIDIAAVFSSLSLERSLPKIDLPVAGLSLAAIVSPVRELLFNVSDTKIAGEITVEGEPTTNAGDGKKSPMKYSFRLRIVDRGAVYRAGEPTDNLETLLKRAAVDAVERFAPAAAIAHYYLIQDYKSARRLVDKYLADNSTEDYEPLLLLRGVIARAEKRYDVAISDYQELISRLPNDFVPHSNLSHVYLDLCRWDEALKESLAGVKLAATDRDRSKAYADAGISALILKKYDEALGYLNLSIKTDPKNAVAYHNLAIVYRDRQEPDAVIAADMFRKATMYDPTIVSTYAVWSKLHDDRGECVPKSP